MKGLAVERKPDETEIARSIKGAVFRAPDNTVRVVAAIRPQHWDDNGQFVKIEATPTSEDGIVWTTPSTPYALRWNAESIVLDYESKKGGKVTVRLIAIDDKPFVAQKPVCIGQSVRTFVHDELEIELRIRAGGVEIFKHLYGPSAPRRLTWEVIEADTSNIRLDLMNTAGRDNRDLLESRDGAFIRKRRIELLHIRAESKEGYTVTEEFTGRTQLVNPESRGRSWVDEVVYPVEIDVTVTEVIVADGDDGYELGGVYWGLGYADKSLLGGTGYRPGWRFQTVDVPQGATITSATLTLECTQSAAVSAVLFGNDADDAAAWANNAGPTAMTPTSASAAIATTTTGTKVLDVTAIVQEIVNRAGWTANNDMAFGVRGTITGSGTGGFADSMDASPSDDPELEIIYSSGGLTANAAITEGNDTVVSAVESRINFDAASNSGYQTAQSTYSWSHTCTGSDRLLRVGVSMLSVLGSSVTGITYNGVALSLVRARASAAGAIRAELWELVAPAEGSNTIAVTLSASLDSVGTAASFTHVNQTTPSEAANDATATNVGAADATVDVTTVADLDMVSDVVATSDTAITVGTGQTQRANIAGALGSGAMSNEGVKTPAGAVTMSWTDVGAAATWTIVSAAIIPVSATVAGITANASITEAGDTLSAAATNAIVAALASTEANDTISAAATLAIVANAAISESADTLAATGTLSGGAITADAAITEANDAISAAATVAIVANLSATEAGDTLSADANTGAPRTADLAVTEENDTLSASASGLATVPTTSTSVGGGGGFVQRRRARQQPLRIADEPPELIRAIINARLVVTEEDDICMATATMGPTIQWQRNRQTLALLTLQ